MVQNYRDLTKAFEIYTNLDGGAKVLKYGATPASQEWRPYKWYEPLKILFFNAKI